MESKINSLVAAISDLNTWISVHGNDTDLASLDVLYNTMGVLTNDLSEEIKRRENQRFSR